MTTGVRSAAVLLRALVVGVEVMLGLSAVYGGIGLLTGTIGMPDTWLEGTPFGSWLIPGISLIVVVAAPMLVAAGLEVRGSRHGPQASVVAGLLQIGWVGVELLVMHRYDPLQPIVLALGVLIVVATLVRVRA